MNNFLCVYAGVMTTVFVILALINRSLLRVTRRLINMNRELLSNEQERGAE